MNWSNVRLIFLREVRDQLRDRRTLFTIAVLPVLLYPLLGMTFLQVAQFMHEQPTRVLLMGAEHLPGRPPLVVSDHFAAEICGPADAALLKLEIDRERPASLSVEDLRARAKEVLESRQFAAVVYIPPDFAQQVEQFGERRKELAAIGTLGGPQLVYNAASDKSRVAYARVQRVLANWRRAFVRDYLKQHDLPANVVDPFSIQQVDVSVATRRQAALWSKILPFVVFIWALTGAFYPAVDVCAGEKERGTLETLLSSPAERSEIVWGKLFTIISFSTATAMLNLLSMAITGTAIIMLQPGQIPIGPPPPSALLWLMLALVPISALFSALALAIAAFARSTKEGQYYLMPLLLVSLPLMVLPLLPAVDLKLGTSLIPITGMMLLIRAMIEGQWTEAIVFLPPVLLVTGGCCLLAIRWAIDQFNNESVLFRESERWGLRLWLRHVLRTRGPIPTAAQAVACASLLLTIRFFATFAASKPTTWSEFAWLQGISIVLLIALPAVVLALILTRDPKKTLLLNRPRGTAVGMAVLLAVTFHPLAMQISQWVQQLYPINAEMHKQLAEIQQLVSTAPSFWQIIALMALAPAVCEELAFRGFILSGLRRLGHKWTAIMISSLFFGLAHGILQQSISATLLGVVVGYIAVQSGSLLPAVAFHLVYNTLGLTVGMVIPEAAMQQPVWGWIFAVSQESVQYQWPWMALMTVLTLVILQWFRRLPYERTSEEKLQHALEHQTPGVIVS